MTIGVLSILRASLVFATVAAVACPADAQVVCLGASNTAGKGVSQQEAYPAQLEIMLRARHYDGGVANAGVSGDTTWGMLNRLDLRNIGLAPARCSMPLVVAPGL